MSIKLYQFANAFFDTKKKIEIARALGSFSHLLQFWLRYTYVGLDDFGVDYIGTEALCDKRSLPAT